MNSPSIHLSLAQSSQVAAAGTPPARPAAETAPLAAQRGADSVELSSAARAADDSPIRLDLVRRVREQISRGTYETLDKIVVAAEGLRREVNVVA